MAKNSKILYLVFSSMVSLAVGVASNVASNQFPEWLQPHLWLSWPILGILVLITIILSMYESNRGTSVGESDKQQASISANNMNRADVGENAQIGQLAIGNNITQTHIQHVPSRHSRFEQNLALGRKFRSIDRLDTTRQRAFDALNKYANSHASTENEYQTQVYQPLDDFSKALEHARIYLSDAEWKIMAVTRSEFTLVSIAIFAWLPQQERDDMKRIDWRSFVEANENARDCLKKLLNPESPPS